MAKHPKQISVERNKREAETCGSCLRATYRSPFSEKHEQIEVDDLITIQIGISVTRLCKPCAKYLAAKLVVETEHE